MSKLRDLKNLIFKKKLLFTKNFFNKYKNYFIVPEIIKGVKTNFLAYPIIIKKNKKFNRKQLQIFLEKKKYSN